MDPTRGWEQIELLCAWDEQREYERIRPLVLFGEPVAERSARTGVSERTLYRRIVGFEEGGMRSLFGAEPAKGRVPPAPLRRLVEDLKAEHPTLNLNEIAGICYARTGRRPHLATVRSVLDEEPLPSWWPSTTAGFRATTSRGTGRTRGGRTEGGALPRSSFR